MQYLVLLGAAVNIIGTSSYIRDTLRGLNQPNRVTWLMWSIAPMIASAAGLSAGFSWVVLPIFMAGFCPFLVLLASFVNKKSYWQLKKLDYICGGLSALALVLWLVTKEPIVAIIFAVLSDALAGLPTLKKSWQYPESESVSAYAAGLFNALTSFAAVKTWAFTEIVFPSYLVLMCSSIIFAIKRPRKLKTA
ncbi:hypothetical protein KKH39_00335 [Patescibacteria group bacterium]|nr:hypothetical protein [Patescibacteria group bacterium]